MTLTRPNRVRGASDWVYGLRLADKGVVTFSVQRDDGASIPSIPSGVWAEDEYAKLPPYDLATWEQPHGVFYCHQQDGRVCAGWAGCHDMDQMIQRLERKRAV